MVDIIIAIAVLLFVALGLREGMVKALTSVVAVFAALMLATRIVNSMNLTASRDISTVILFFILFFASYVILDLLLTLLFKRVITVTVLGPVDKVGGVAVGAFKGLLISAVALQLLFYCPLEAATITQLKESYLSRLAIAVFQWSYPYVKNVRPEIADFIKTDYLTDKETGKVEKKSTEDVTKAVGDAVDQYKKREKDVMKLLEENKLVPGVPEK